MITSSRLVSSVERPITRLSFLILLERERFAIMEYDVIANKRAEIISSVMSYDHNSYIHFVFCFVLFFLNTFSRSND